MFSGGIRITLKSAAVSPAGHNHSQSALITMWCSQSRSWCSAGPHTYKWGRTGWECGGWSHHEAEKCRKERRKKPLSSSGTCLEQQPAIRPWKSPGTQAVSQRSPPLSSVIVQPSKQEIKAWWQETRVVEQTETKNGNSSRWPCSTWRIEGSVGSYPLDMWISTVGSYPLECG